jgi:hypothetical protein
MNATIRRRILQIGSWNPEDISGSITHASRLLLEDEVFAALRTAYISPLRTWWQTHVIPKNPTKSIVIYETRRHPQLEFLILNCAHYASTWGLTLFCSEENHYHILEILGHNAQHARVIVQRQKEGDYTQERDTYNTFTTSRTMWEMLDSFGFTHVLLAEVDAYLLDHLETIQDLEEYDYVASEWSWSTKEPGGGGLSIRRVRKMLELCDYWDSQQSIPTMQDCWASKGIECLQGKYSHRFFAESALLEKAWGVHQWWSFIHPLNDEAATVEMPVYENYMDLQCLRR